MLLYANRATQQGVQFKVHGQLAVSDLQVVDSEPRMGADFCFNIYDGKRALMVIVIIIDLIDIIIVVSGKGA